MTRDELEDALIASNEVFRAVTPAGMNFSEPESLKPYRGLFQKVDAPQTWKAIFGTATDFASAWRTVLDAGYAPQRCNAPDHMFAFVFTVRECV